MRLLIQITGTHLLIETQLLQEMLLQLELTEATPLIGMQQLTLQIETVLITIEVQL